MGSTFKMYDDRRFCDGHRSVYDGQADRISPSAAIMLQKPIYRWLSKPEVKSEGISLPGVASDETDPDTEIDRLAQRLDYADQA